MKSSADIRPFYFMVSVWGASYCDFLSEICVPSLLAPGNVPSLPRGDHKFLVACPRADWSKLRVRASFEALSRYLEIEHLEIPPPSPDVPSTVHMGTGHILATRRCFEDQAYGVALTPDMLLSDEAVARLVELARQGKTAVLVAALRFAQEPLFEGLRRHGLLPAAIYDGARREPLVISGRNLLRLGVASFHSQTKAYRADGNGFPPGAVPAILWDVPGDNGVLVHCMSWAPILLDYRTLSRHDTTALENWTMDGDYIHANFKDLSSIHVVDDSDEMMLVSWAPSSDRPASLEGNWLVRHCGPLRRALNAMAFRTSARSDLFDDLKRHFLRVPVRWHTEPLGDNWAHVEATAGRVVDLKPRIHDSLYAALAPGLRRNLSRIDVCVRALYGDGAARAIIRNRLRGERRRVFREAGGSR